MFMPNSTKTVPNIAMAILLNSNESIFSSSRLPPTPSRLPRKIRSLATSVAGFACGLQRLYGRRK
jgi:hypothetical protein